MRILIAADSFKDSLSSLEACQAIGHGVKKAMPEAEITIFPLSDGGEGLVDVFEFHLSGQRVELTVQDPLGRPVKAGYLFFAKNKMAVVEWAAASGLHLLTQDERNPAKTSSFGTGQLLRDAVERGATTIILGLGGSATNDAGIGMATALGTQFLDQDGHILEPIGDNLVKVAKVLHGDFLRKTKAANVRFEVWSDVANPLHGPNGAAKVYARQKGADDRMVEQLDQGLQHFASLLEAFCGKPIAHVPGSGAAGGAGAGAIAFLEAKLRPGMASILKMLAFEENLEGVDLVLTGEGRLDGQTLNGKLVLGICQAAKKKDIPVVALCGSHEISAEQQESIGLTAAFSIVKKPVTLAEALKSTGEGLENLAYNIMKIIHLH